MMVRKVPVKVVLNAEELNKMAMFFEVLVAVDRRVNGNKKKAKKAKTKPKDQTKITSIWNEACLKSRSFYFLTTPVSLRAAHIASTHRRYINDRHSCFNTRLGYIQHH